MRCNPGTADGLGMHLRALEYPEDTAQLSSNRASERMAGQQEYVLSGFLAKCEPVLPGSRSGPSAYGRVSQIGLDHAIWPSACCTRT